MRHRSGTRAGRVFGLAGHAQAVALENLEQRQLLAADLGGIRLVLSPDGTTAEVREWTGEHNRIDGGGSADPVTFQLIANDQYRPGPNNRTAPTATIWNEFVHEQMGPLQINYDAGTPFHLGQSFDADRGYDLGWFIEGRPGNQQSISFLHELPEAVEIPDLNGSWTYSSIAIPTSGGPGGTSIEGAYGTINVTDLLGNFTWSANIIGGTDNGTGAIQSLTDNGLGKISNAEYFHVSEDLNYLTAVDLSYADGMTYITIATRRTTGITEKDVAGEYRYGAAFTGQAASQRGEDLIAFESVYLKLNLDRSLTAYDLEDWDNGTETVLHTGIWSLLPDNRSVLVTYDDTNEGHLLGFGQDSDTFIDLRIESEEGASYVLGVGQRVSEDDGEIGDRDDHANEGDFDNATTITLSSAGSGSESGVIEPAEDTDLFRFTARFDGDASISLDTSGGDLRGEITLLDADGNVLDSAVAGASEIGVSLNWDVLQNDLYFVLVSSFNDATTGGYNINITTEADDGGGGGGGGGGGDTDDGYVDDFGQGDDGSGDTLADPDDVPFPQFTIPGRAPTGRQAIWEFGADGNWYYSKLGLRSDTPDIYGEFVKWRDNATDEHMVAAAAAEGMILWVRDEDSGLYTKRNLTEEAGEDAEVPAGPVTRFELSDGRNALAAVSAAGDVLVYVESQGSTFMVNLSEDEVRDSGGTVPPLEGKLAAGISEWGTTIIVGLDAEGKVWSVWFSEQRPQDRWSASPLSKIAKALPMEGNISIYFTSWNGINVAGLGEGGETRVIWWVPSFQGKWEVVNLTARFDGPTFKPGTMTTYSTPWNALTIVGITDAGRMVAYWWAPGFTEWAIADFSELLPRNNPRVIRGPIHYELRANNNIWLFGRNTSEEMVRVVWSRAADSWRSNIINVGATQF